jgi:hypothetical protein
MNQLKKRQDLPCRHRWPITDVVAFGLGTNQFSDDACIWFTLTLYGERECPIRPERVGVPFPNPDNW